MRSPEKKKHFGKRVLDARNLVKIYKGATHPSLNGIDISVDEGEIIGLLGPNGAGKTTVVSILSTLMQPTLGSITLFGIDLIRHPGQAKKFLGFVPQEIALYPKLTALENLAYFGRLNGLHGKPLKKRISECLELVGLEEKANALVCTYSGGMKRRANLAVGILHTPKILFLDEPTVGIDAQSRNMILEKLKLLQKSKTSMIYTTHYMEEAEQLCSKVSIIDNGRIITEGNPRELIEQAGGSGNLGELFLGLTGKCLRD